MIVLDTNVLSEIMRPKMDAAFQVWVEMSSDANFYTSSITVAEISYGILLLPEGKKKKELQLLAKELFVKRLAGMILPFDEDAAQAYAELLVFNKKRGRADKHHDMQIAAICRVHKATLATRNVRDFEDCGIKLINPWQKK